MSRTVTGSYTLRPVSQRTYKSGTFSDWFSTSVSAPSSWATNLNAGTKIGDDSDSTYINDTSIGTDSTGAKNNVMNMHVTSGTVPSFPYTITSVTLSFRNKTSSSTNASRIFRIWNTLYWTNDNKLSSPAVCQANGRFVWKHAIGSSGSVSVGTTSIKTYSYSTPSEQANPSMPADEFPDLCAICVQAYKTSHLTSFNSYQLYDVWYVVEYSYEEPTDVTATVKADSGTAVSGDATVQAGTTANVTFDEGTIVSLTAEPADGYVFDGWYSGGSKVAETTTYSFTISAAVLYAISHKRNLYVGNAKVKEVYIGTTKIGEIYSGSEPIWKDSELLAEATGGTT